MSVPELLGIPYSPWSEKARWALDARRVAYRSRTYAPLLGEPALRWKLRRLRGVVSVPVLTDEAGRVIDGSTEIARWADERGEGPRLFPPGATETIERFDALAEQALRAGRVLALRRVLDDDAALEELVPRALRRAPGRLASRVAALGIARTLRKYGSSGVSPAEAERELTIALDALRAALAAAPEPAATGPKTLLGSLSYADIAMAQALTFVAPPATLRLGNANRRCFTDAAVASRYADLVAWRDALYATHRGA